MLQAVLEQMETRFGTIEANILTTYPEADTRERLRAAGNIIPAKPWQLVFPMLPLALLMACLRAVRLPWQWLALNPALRALTKADVVLDLAGISFVDGRGFPILVYNTLMTGIPVLVGAKVIKCSQALGPFNKPLTRLAARLVLPRLAAVCARGHQTYEHLRHIPGVKAVEAADLAFLMQVPEDAKREALELTRAIGADYVALAPSAVVRNYCQRIGLDYPRLVVETVDKLTAAGLKVVLFPHSYKENEPESRMNDGPLCREIHSQLAQPDSCLLLDRSLPPSVLRAIIQRSQVLVTSRFHAMISALSTEVPVIVMGWSHKYAEVMSEFGLEEFVYQYSALDSEHLSQSIFRILADRDVVAAKIRTQLPNTKRSAMRNVDVVERVVSGA